MSDMDVIFERAGERRYAVRARRSGFPTVEMNPAPGYDPHLPHDLIHFVVEDELGLSLGVFGQLAAGGDAGTFRLPAGSRRSRERTRAQRRIKRRGSKLAHEGREQAELSETAASIAHFEWLSRSSRTEHQEAAEDMRAYVRRLTSRLTEAGRGSLTEGALDRICERLNELGDMWSSLEVGQSMTLSWKA